MAGQPPPPWLLVNVPRLVTAYYTERPDPSVPAQRVAFGTSGHRGSSLDVGFNEGHILAMTQAICLYRREQGIEPSSSARWCAWGAKNTNQEMGRLQARAGDPEEAS